jgi:hypothetical protein
MMNRTYNTITNGRRPDQSGRRTNDQRRDRRWSVGGTAFLAALALSAILVLWQGHGFLAAPELHGSQPPQSRSEQPHLAVVGTKLLGTQGIEVLEAGHSTLPTASR